MTDSQIIGEIAAQHALLLELANQQRNTLAAVSALAELVISQAAGSGDENGCEFSAGNFLKGL